VEHALLFHDGVQKQFLNEPDSMSESEDHGNPLNPQAEETFPHVRGQIRLQPFQVYSNSPPTRKIAFCKGRDEMYPSTIGV